jgi:hypothetical protein
MIGLPRRLAQRPCILATAVLAPLPRSGFVHQAQSGQTLLEGAADRVQPQPGRSK